MAGYYCSSCGTLNPIGAKFCSKCGHPVGAPASAATQNTAAAQPMTTTSAPGTSGPIGAAPIGAAPIGAPVSQPVATPAATPAATTTSMTPAGGNAAQAPAAHQTQQPATRPAQGNRSSMPSASSFSQSELWTWLKKDDRRQLFYRDGQEAPSEADYMRLVGDRLAQNGVPATIERRRISWDRSELAETMYVVNPSTTAVDPLSCVLQFASIGDFSFVDEKTFLAPPNLPPVPEKKVPIPANKNAGAARMGVIAIAIGIVLFLLNDLLGGSAVLGGIALCAVGAFLVYIESTGGAAAKKAREHNAKVDRQEFEWERAWDRWETEVFIHSFQESTHGQVTRIYQAVFESIKQVNTELFSNAIPVDEREETKMGELEQQIARRKKSYR